MLTFTQTGILSALCLSQIRWYNKRKHWSASPGWGWGGRGNHNGNLRGFSERKGINCGAKADKLEQWNEHGWRCINTDKVQRGIYSRSPARGNWTEHSCTLVQVGLSRPRTLPQPSRNCRCSAGLLQIRHLQKANKSSIMLLCAAGQSTKTRGEGRERRGEALMAHPALRVSWMGRVRTAAWISSLSTGDSRSKPGQKYQNK